MKRRNTIIWLLCLLPVAVQADVRTEYDLKQGWKFCRDDSTAFSTPAYDDTRWQTVTVPHDWAIYGPFSPYNDRQHVAIAQDGQTQALEHAGRTGGLPFVGVGWYRLTFEAPAFRPSDKATLIFDGAMSHARVYVNGHEAGYWPYGYNAFHLDVTPYLKAGETNVLAVRLENLPESSRWYPGAGLYRHVHLRVNRAVHVPVWGVQLTTPVVKREYAKVRVRTTLDTGGARPSDCRIVTRLKDSQGHTVAERTDTLAFDDENTFDQMLVVASPRLWSPETPTLYTAESAIYHGAELTDECTTVFGIRSLAFVPDQGFFLNGKKTRFKGVCLHHDLGPLGAAVNDAAIRRQIRILRDMGCNAIRTSHNMPAPELVQACDEMGMMLMAESFDEWKLAKCANGYNRLFDQWAERDLVNLLRQFRNHPSIVMWCIGNEVTEQRADGGLGAKITRALRDICHREDPTRPVTAGLDAPDEALVNNMAATLDIPGFNYRPHKYPEAYARLPQQLILGSETASTVSSRGVYKFPVARRQMQRYADHQASSYDVECCSWSNLPEDDFIQHDDLPWCIGEFAWTGFDYLGEPTPYYTDWPSHSSLFGIVDLAGLPKDRYYLYRSHWNEHDETLHILPHWNWPGREGQTTPVFVYTSYPSAELFINGKSQGRLAKDTTVTVYNSGDSASIARLARQRRYRLMWMDTRYEPGKLTVVAYDCHGKPAARKELHTAGPPHHIELTADRDTIRADGQDLAFITVKVVDRHGNLCPGAQHLLRFKVKGDGIYRAGANGDPTCLLPFHQPRMNAFNGMMTAIVQSTERPGTLVLEATGKGLRGATLTVTTLAAGQGR